MPMLAMRRHARSSTMFAVVLVAALLSAQLAGVQHRIAHGLSGIWSAAKAPSFDTGKHGHSCELLDAATLAAGAATKLFVTPVLPPHPKPIAAPAYRSWLAPFVAHFSPRAPPYPAA